MIIQGVTLNNITVYDSSFNSNGALLYVDAGQSASYCRSGTTNRGLSGWRQRRLWYCNTLLNSQINSKLQYIASKDK
jgi:hypothetical protein